MPLLKLAEHYFYILSRFFRVDSFFRPFRFALCHSSLYQKVKFLGLWVSKTGSKKMGLLLHEPNKDLVFMNELFEAGKVVPIVDRIYSLSEVPEALRYFGEGDYKGKVVITV
ncbi:zinc-binding dehydrogenase [Chloroflexi bacterium TSY]|nr:zinc-binding dehydrogenase [Chloroflexi bacterium TSY]